MVKNPPIWVARPVSFDIQVPPPLGGIHQIQQKHNATTLNGFAYIPANFLCKPTAVHYYWCIPEEYQLFMSGTLTKKLNKYKALNIKQGAISKLTVISFFAFSISCSIRRKPVTVLPPWGGTSWVFSSMFTAGCKGQMILSTGIFCHRSWKTITKLVSKFVSYSVPTLTTTGLPRGQESFFHKCMLAG